MFKSGVMLPGSLKVQFTQIYTDIKEFSLLESVSNEKR